MNRLFSGLMLALLMSGCGAKEESAAPADSSTGSSASTSGNPLTAPVDYLGALAKAKNSSEVKIGTTSIQGGIRMYEAEHGKRPASLDELVKSGHLRSLPKLPPTIKWSYDADTGAVTVESTQ